MSKIYSDIMGWFEASIVFIVGIIAFVIILPFGQALLPNIQETMGSYVAMMVSAMFVVILVVIIMLYFRQSQEPDTFLSGGGEQI